MTVPAIASVLVLVAALGQSDSRSFAGTWTLIIRGQTLARLELTTARDGLAGQISLGAMHVNAEGEVDEVIAPATNVTPLFDLVLRDGMLSFARKDGDDTDRFEMRVTGDTAQLAFLITEEFRQELKDSGIPVPKPVTLTRTRQ